MTTSSDRPNTALHKGYAVAQTDLTWSWQSGPGRVGGTGGTAEVSFAGGMDA